MPGLNFPSIPDDEALETLRRRGVNFRPSGYWHEIWQKEHETAFTVAQSAGYDILGDIYEAVYKAMADGDTFAEFRRKLTPILQAKGWWGKTDDGRFLGTPWRLNTILDQNLRVSSARGDWERSARHKQSMPYLRYTALLDGRTRPLHRKWHGTILPVGHPWWRTHYPPNGWRCRCKAMSVSGADLADYGWKVTDPAPDDGCREWENPSTGEKIEVPNGIDPGWAYNPGERDHTRHIAEVAMGKLAEMPPGIASAGIDKMMAIIPEETRTSLGRMAVSKIIAKGLARWMKKPEKPFPLAVLTIDDAAEIGASVQVAKMSAGTFAKQVAHHPELTEADYMLAQKAVEMGGKFQQDSRNLVYIIDEPGGVVVIVKATKTGKGLFVTSLRRMSRDQARRDEEIKRLKTRKKQG